MKIHGALLALAYPERIAKNRGGGPERFCWPMGAARRSIPPPRSPASRFSRSPSLAGTAAAGRILLAAPITLAEIEAHFADRIETREEVTFDAASLSLRGRRSRRLGALVLSEQPFAVEPGRGNRAETRRRDRRASASTGCRGRKALRQWRDRVMFLRASEGDEWPDLSDAALGKAAERMAGAGAARQRLRSPNSLPMNWTRH